MFTTFSTNPSTPIPTNGRVAASSTKPMYRTPTTATTPLPQARAQVQAAPVQVASAAVAAASNPLTNTTDDYERWYTEQTTSNRMVLALRSGIHTEVSWALDRFCRLCCNDRWFLRTLPNTIDALFEWPEWYIANCNSPSSKLSALFSISPDEERKRKFGLEAMFIMRNAAVGNETNARDLAAHKQTRPLLLSALYGVQPDTDANTEFLIHALEFLQCVAPSFTLPPPSAPKETNPIPALVQIVRNTTNRTIIIAALSALNALLAEPSAGPHVNADSPALAAALRYLALLTDKQLFDAAVNYLYTHLSHPPMAKAFLLHRDMPSTLKLLVCQIIAEQVEDQVRVDVGGKVHTAPAHVVATRTYELTKEELDGLASMPEPERCYEWMRRMFLFDPKKEVTQVELWTLYRDSFLPYQDRHQLLVASEVIRNVNFVFPLAQAMVIETTKPSRFIVSGVGRRQVDNPNERFRCHWNRSQCQVAPWSSAGELYDHVLEHINGSGEGQEQEQQTEGQCQWATCSQGTLPKSRLRAHVLTHLPKAQPDPKHPEQGNTITLPSEDDPYPTPDPTKRKAPPPRSAIISYPVPLIDPPSSALTSLLCIRILFRTSFATLEAAPRVDGNHFGFPGIVEEEELGEEDEAEVVAMEEEEEEGARRGKKAFVGVRRLLESVRIKEETLMGWIEEMVQASL